MFQNWILPMILCSDREEETFSTVLVSMCSWLERYASGLTIIELAFLSPTPAWQEASQTCADDSGGLHRANQHN